MGAQYPKAIWIPHNKWGYPQGRTGRNGQQLRYIIEHGTAGAGTAQDIAHYFATTTRPAGTHFIIGQDGTVVQCVLIENAAWGNGGPIEDATHKAAPFWPRNINANLLTVSIEHCKPHTDNSDLLTAVQQEASFELDAWLCQHYGIPARAADAAGGITGHYSIDPVNKARCPGPFPWSELWTALGAKVVDYKSQQAADVWHTTGQPDNTGIHQAWLEQYTQHSIVLGPPLGAEFHTVDWAGNKIVCQYFANGRIEYYVEAAPNHPAGSNHGYTDTAQLW